MAFLLALTACTATQHGDGVSPRPQAWAESSSAGPHPVERL